MPHPGEHIQMRAQGVRAEERALRSACFPDKGISCPGAHAYLACTCHPSTRNLKAHLQACVKEHVLGPHGACTEECMFSRLAHPMPTRACTSPTRARLPGACNQERTKWWALRNMLLGAEELTPRSTRLSDEHILCPGVRQAQRTHGSACLGALCLGERSQACTPRAARAPAAVCAWGCLRAQVRLHHRAPRRLMCSKASLCMQSL